MIHNKDYEFYSNPENVKSTTKLTNVITNTPIYNVRSNSNIRLANTLIEIRNMDNEVIYSSGPSF